MREPRDRPMQRCSRDYPTARTLVGSGQTGCCYCNNEDHSPVQCKRVVLVEERKRIIRAQGRCFTCLRPGHISSNCRSSYKCGKCSGRHHLSLCMKSNKFKSYSEGIQNSSKSQNVDTSNSSKKGLNPASFFIA